MDTGPTMQTIQIVLDEKLLRATDAAAKRHKLSRSELILRAIQGHLDQLRTTELERRDRLGYQTSPQRIKEYRPWEKIAAWPEA